MPMTQTRGFLSLYLLIFIFTFGLNTAYAEKNSDDVDVLSSHKRVDIKIAGPHALEVQTTLLEGLRQKGFSSSPDAELLIEGDVRFKKVGPKGPVWHFIRWDARIILKQRETGQVIGTIRRSGREGQRSDEEAEGKALSVLQSELREAVGDEVSRLLPERQGKPGM